MLYGLWIHNTHIPMLYIDRTFFFLSSSTNRSQVKSYLTLRILPIMSFTHHKRTPAVLFYPIWGVLIRKPWKSHHMWRVIAFAARKDQRAQRAKIYQNKKGRRRFYCVSIVTSKHIKFCSVYYILTQRLYTRVFIKKRIFRTSSSFSCKSAFLGVALQRISVNFNSLRHYD